MTLPIEVTRRVVRYDRDRMEDVQDTVVTEYPVTITINGEEFATLVCTPEHMEDLAAGFLASEGVIRTFADIEQIGLDEEEGFIHISTRAMNAYYRDFHSKRYIGSCCGKSRQGFYFMNDAATKPLTDIQVTLSAQDCFRLMAELHGSAETFRNTGGVHNAALCDRNGILLSRMDIGRHNALDKIYGHCLRHQVPLSDKIIVFSGRISSEILLKAAKIGCGVVVSKSAPTELALQLADDLGITAVGFVRNDSLNVYTHPERVERG
ncbi:formate dehydrogenase accessory sulfurtransferase FdhD [Paenibacillus humicola]|uniref:formate dehydrogenase accessory sulfurtransferase FdhD n=1 Tax=Paenibacillus humicola TaxID=3110540 RepID=UPI00237A43C0|nr:formate dehydrogenase accessory sulfurtransferase FdhD [Paenibacillus humicola]